MPSYLITGVSRGIGFEFVRQLSGDPRNVVVGLVRNLAGTEEAFAQSDELKSRPNIHLLEADIADFNALKSTVPVVGDITGGSLDYVIANAAYVGKWDGFEPIGILGSREPERFEEELFKNIRVNVLANINLFNLFMPLVLKSKVKKVIAISSGHADPELINNFDIAVASLYTISKAALNTAVAKFNAQYKSEGVLFLSISPGFVDVGHFKDVTPEQQQALAGMVKKFAEYAPHFKGPVPAEKAIKDVLSVIWKASLENGDGGAFVSQFGNKQWL